MGNLNTSSNRDTGFILKPEDFACLNCQLDSFGKLAHHVKTHLGCKVCLWRSSIHNEEYPASFLLITHDKWDHCPLVQTAYIPTTDLNNFFGIRRLRKLYDTQFLRN